MSASPTPPPNFDPSRIDFVSPDRFVAEGYPHADWAWLRANDPVHYVDYLETTPFYALTKHADIVDVGKNPTDWIIEPRIAIFPDIERDELGALKHLLSMDPPDHARYRNLAAKAFTPRAVQVWAEKIREITQRHVNRANEMGEFDFVDVVSAPITIEVIALMLGVPEADWQKLFDWTQMTIAPSDPEYSVGTPQETINKARAELFAYFTELCEERRKHPLDDIASRVANSTIDGEPLGPLELLSYMLLLVVAGNETTRNSMTGGVQAFLDNPAQWAALDADEGLVEGAIEETVRWTTAVIQFARTATRDMEIRGQTIREGEAVGLYYASANRDEDVFEDPNVFRIDRWPNNHLSFGRGEHVCLGAHLARLEIRALYQELRGRVVEMERTGPIERMQSSFVGGVKRAPMRWQLRD